MYKFFSIYSIENVMESLRVSLSIFVQKKKGTQEYLFVTPGFAFADL